ncbi:MAG TPA: fused response regulator/phosphatase, partial [Desulfobacterales bacterium]|nr:fused response regulator/phosphatase [Desulfobacterales bacterium]
MPTGGILVIDDNKVIRRLCESLLSILNVPYNEAKTAEEGFHLADSCSPDIILLDICLPDADGFEVLKRLKDHSLVRKSHIIMLTSESDIETIVRALKEGASDYIRKPFAGRELVARVKNLLLHRQSERTIAKDLATGAALQQKFLTPETDLLTTFANCGYHVQTYSRPYASVSGDFFYPVSFNDCSCGLFFGDTCGHGLSAALISMRIIGSLHTMVYANNSPANHLQLLNEDLQGVLPKDRFIAACYIFFMQDTMILSNAGQPYPVKISGSKVKEIRVGGYPIGQFSEPWYNNEFVPVNSSDRILIYSDGLIEAQNRDGECFGRERLFQILSKTSGVTLKKMVAAIVRELEKFCGNTQYEDDVSLIALEKSSPKTDNRTSIPNTQHAIGEFIEQFKKRIIKKYILTDKHRDYAEYVLIECLDNAWEHGNKRDPDLSITLIWSVSEVIRIRFPLGKYQGKNTA